MKNIAKVMYLVSGILSFVEAAGVAIGGLVCIIIGVVTSINAPSNTDPNAVLAAEIALYIVGGILMAYIAVFVASGILAFKARGHLYANRASKGIHIANIVFGALALGAVQIAPAVLSLIVLTREENSRVIDAN